MGADVASEAGPRLTLSIEIVWVEADGSIGRRTLALSTGSRVADAFAALRADEAIAILLERLARGELQAAVYGERCDPSAPLHPGDRIELLAGLSVDPKVARRRRVEKRRALEPRSKWRRD
ncbi:MAG: RnfH family protein [Burkholderiaceae bacterium]|nr:RnfH family protein [Burkholderiaceae bacterium]